MTASIIGTLVLIAALAAVFYKSVRIVPQATADIVERFGRYHRTLGAGFNIVIPFIDAVRTRIELREMIVGFPPQSVMTKENLAVSVDMVVSYQVVDAEAATYKVTGFVAAVEQRLVGALRGVIAGMDFDTVLGSRERIERELLKALGEATRPWGIEVGRVELKSVDPPAAIRDALDRRLLAERDRRAAVAAAESKKQAAVLTAEGEKQAAVLRARGEAEAMVLRAKAEAEARAVRAQGEADAIALLSKAVHDGDPDPRLLAYEYLRTLPRIAEGDANKVWIVPSELGKTLEGLEAYFADRAPEQEGPDG
ncbi:MAG: SPFH/Band 7/PHB domain protein [Streptosporangiales bacterium]|nr:SPFH/Band 7/PHB domain protein [Streptosporangiales bacterium]